MVCTFTCQVSGAKFVWCIHLLVRFPEINLYGVYIYLLGFRRKICMVYTFTCQVSGDKFIWCIHLLVRCTAINLFRKHYLET
jgi:hypothetical protein